MTPERWQRIEDLYHAACGRESAPERDAFLSDACGTDYELRSEIESLLAQDESKGILDRPVISLANSELRDGAPKPGVGSQIGPYRIEASIGKGGMGEVWKARDTRLNREVAIKISAQQFTGRFEREARAIAALNHPNICTIHDVGLNYLVMEFVEGPTLAERIRQGSVPLDEALGIATQIADALEAAHAKGIVHRDLKPANIKIRPDGSVKVLDFGLAKATCEEPTLTPDTATISGMILGTPGYMAPEQARGEKVDKRADIWAFGVVLYEMLTGRRAFDAKAQAGIIAPILEREPPDVKSFQPSVPRSLERALMKCLATSPDRRWQTAADLRDELEWIADDLLRNPAEKNLENAGISRRLWPLVTIISGLVISGALGWLWRPSIEKPSLELSLMPPAGTSFHWLQAGAMSPDGRFIVLVAVSGGQSQLWVRRLDRAVSRPLPGTEGATAPFWSPDSRVVGFFADRKLKKVALTGGSPQVLCDASAGRGGAWSPHGFIVFAPVINGSLFRVADSGGEPVLLTRFDASRQENAHYWPQFLRDGRRFIYLARSVRPDLCTIQLGSADAAPETQPRTKLLNTLTSAAYVPPGQGIPSQLLFIRNGTLFAQQFDEGSGHVEGEPVPVRDGAGAAPFVGLADFSASQDGTLVYGTGSNFLARLTWWSREGKQLGNLGATGTYLAPKLSPDGSVLAVTRADPQTGSADVWIINSSRNSESRFTFDPAFDFHPVWSPDGKRILFSSNRSGAFNLFQKEVTGRAQEQELSRTEQTQLAEDWSRDGRFALFLDQRVNTAQDLWILPLQLPQKPFPFARTESSERNGQFSPNGRWIAYDSDETGSYQVYVQAFFGEERLHSAKWQISISGGSQPRWRSDGREIFYIGTDRKLMSVEVSEPTSTFQVSTPRTLFDAGVLAINDFSFFYDVAPDGKRFLLVTPANQDRAAPLSVVTNFRAQLK